MAGTVLEDTEITEKTDRASLDLLFGISREFATALDLRTVLHRVLFLSMKNVGAITGSIIVLDDNARPVETAFMHVDQPHDRTTIQLKATYDHGLAGWVAKKRRAVLISDTSKDERWLQLPDDDIDQTGPKSAVSAPILARDKLVGVMTLVHPQRGFFSSSHLDLVQAIADQAGVVILNAWLYAVSQRRAQVMSAVAESAALITASLELENVLESILEQISQALGVEGTSLALIDNERDELVFQASTIEDPQSVVGMRIPLGSGIAGWVASHGEGVEVSDVNKDPRFFPDVDQVTGFETRAILCAPIRLQDKVIGVLEALNPKSGVFDESDLLVLNGIGSLAGTAIRHAQLFESLQDTHKRYRELFQDSIDPIIITDFQGCVLEINRIAETFIGLEGSELDTLNISKLHDIDEEMVGVNFSSLVHGETLTYESILHTYGKNDVPVQVYVRSIRDGGSSRLQWILRDISERKYLDNLREDLIAMVYHDLRSPLSNISSSLEVLASTPVVEQDLSTDSLLQIALRSTERIRRLTNSLLDINRLEAGQTIGDRDPVRPFDLVEESMDAVLPAIGDKSLQVDVDVPVDLTEVLVDVDMIRRVVINLLENAIKYSPVKGEISIGARLEEDFVIMWVEDSGPGISPEDKERIFEKFTRLDNGSARGFGLGLAFCRLAIAGHGGRIWVESESDAGSKFIFSLPTAERTKE